MKNNNLEALVDKIRKGKTMNNRLQFFTVFMVWTGVVIGNVQASFLFGDVPVVMVSYHQGISLLILWFVVRYFPDFP